MRLRYRKILITILLVIEILLVNLTYQSFLHREINKEENKITKKQFAMYIKEKDEYVEYKGNNLFPKGYYVNKTLSKCVDDNDNPVEDAINSIGNSVTITSNKTIYCTLYFDKNEILEYLRSKDTNNSLSEDIVGDMYRYQGLYTDDIRNYICLGDNCCKTSECAADSNDDMYRIIGINDNGEMKVIKKTALTDSVKWWSDYKTDIKWPQSLIYQKLNGKSEVLIEPNFNDANSYYYSLDSKLKEIIVNNHSWLYGDVYAVYNNPFDYSGDIIFGIESGKSEATYFKKEDGSSPSGKYMWNEKIEAPIGLMYISDYYYAYKTSEKDVGNPGSYSNAINSWIHLSHNESVNIIEWTMSRYGFRPSVSDYVAWPVGMDGEVSNGRLYAEYAVRPTFYITSNVELIGEGTLDEPFEIDYEKNGVDIINSKPANLNNEETGGMHRYQGTYEDVNNNYICFGTNDRDKCLNNQDTYMYRIIGISKNGEMKLIKQEYLDKKYFWNLDYTTKVEWPDSEVYRAINNEGYLNNENYLSKSDDINWPSKIISKNWYYGYIGESISLTGEEIYEIETGNKETQWNEREDGVTTPSEGIRCSVDSSPGVSSGQTRCYRIVNGYWTNKVPAKIGLSYLHDIKLSIGNNQTCTVTSDCEKGWILKYNYPTNLHSGSHNYLITAYSYYVYWDAYDNLTISPVAPFGNGVLSEGGFAVRPTFYVDGNTTFKGNGTINYPYLVIK